MGSASGSIQLTPSACAACVGFSPARTRASACTVARDRRFWLIGYIALGVRSKDETPLSANAIRDRGADLKQNPDLWLQSNLLALFDCVPDNTQASRYVTAPGIDAIMGRQPHARAVCAQTDDLTRTAFLEPA